MNEYEIGLTSDKIWNVTKLIQFLSSNRGQAIKLTIAPEAIDLSIVYHIIDCFEFESVEIHTHNPFEKHNKYNIVHKPIDVWAGKQTIDPILHTWNQEKVFYCLYGRPTAGRLGMAAYMLSTYYDETHVHFSATTDEDDLTHYELDKLLEYAPKLITPAGILINQMPLLLETSDNYTAFNGYDYTDPLTTYYQDILIDLVVESHVVGNTFFPTEKTFRPMWMKKPFITFATIGFNEYLKQMGFKTFNDYWPEEYDGLDGNVRMQAIFNLINNIMTKSKSELISMYNDMQDILDHNYNLLLTQQFKREVYEQR